MVAFNENAANCHLDSNYRPGTSRLLKNGHLLRYPHPSSLQRTAEYASLLRISEALHLALFEQPGKDESLKNLRGNHLQRNKELPFPFPGRLTLAYVSMRFYRSREHKIRLGSRSRHGSLRIVGSRACCQEDFWTC